MIEEGPPTRTGPPGDPELGKFNHIATLDVLLATVKDGTTLPQIAVDMGGSLHVHSLVAEIRDTKYWDGAPKLSAIVENPLDLIAEWPKGS